MSFNPPASLTAQLLVTKGGAVPAGFISARPPAHLTIIDAGKSVRPNMPSPKVTTKSARARVTLRLNADRHLKLKLAAAHSRKSIQAIVTAALDRYLDQTAPDLCGGACSCLGSSNPPLGK